MPKTLQFLKRICIFAAKLGIKWQKSSLASLIALVE